jgi:hypothetical protein
VIYNKTYNKDCTNTLMITTTIDVYIVCVCAADPVRLAQSIKQRKSSLKQSNRGAITTSSGVLRRKGDDSIGDIEGGNIRVELTVDTLKEEDGLGRMGGGGSPALENLGGTTPTSSGMMKPQLTSDLRTPLPFTTKEGEAYRGGVIDSIRNSSLLYSDSHPLLLDGPVAVLPPSISGGITNCQSTPVTPSPTCQNKPVSPRNRKGDQCSTMSSSSSSSSIRRDGKDLNVVIVNSLRRVNNCRPDSRSDGSISNVTTIHSSLPLKSLSQIDSASANVSVSPVPPQSVMDASSHLSHLGVYKDALTRKNMSQPSYGSLGHSLATPAANTSNGIFSGDIKSRVITVVSPYDVHVMKTKLTPSQPTKSRATSNNRPSTAPMKGAVYRPTKWYSIRANNEAQLILNYQCNATAEGKNIFTTKTRKGDKIKNATNMKREISFIPVTVPS